MDSSKSLGLEHASRDTIERFQLERLKSIVQRAYDTVPFYKKSFDAADFHPENLNSLSDFSLVPFLTKNDLRHNPVTDFLTVPINKILRWHCSSGTSGTPITMGYTRHDIELWSSVVARALYYAGVNSGDVLLNTHGYGLFTGGLGVHYGSEKLGCTIIPSSTGRTSLQVQLLNRLKANVLVGTPTYVLRLAEEVAKQGIDINKDLNLRICICGAEPWSEARRREIEKKLNVTAMDLYGLTEVIGPGVASEHTKQKGQLIVWEDHFYPEVIRGELVMTTLTREGMPIIRFKTGDLTQFCNTSALSFRSIERIHARSDEMIKIRGVSFYPSQIEELLSDDPRFSGFYKIELSTVDHLDQICIHLESFLSRDFAIELERLFQNKLGLKIHVQLLPPGSLENNNSKARRINDLRTSS